LVERHAIKARQRGLTLVELLVVLVILGLASGAALMNAPPARPPARVAAESFAAKYSAISDLAVASGKPVRLVVDTASYQFEVRRDGEWQASDDARFDRTVFGEGLTVTVEVDAAAFANEPEASKRKADEPVAIALDPLGAEAPFSIEFAHRRGVWRVDVGADGEARLVALNAR
jgi:general secretion pathway protein H